MIGVVVPYLGLYLISRGYSALQVGQIAAMILATKIIAPNIWSWWADKLDNPMWLVRGGLFMAIILFSAVYIVKEFWLLVLLFAGYSFFLSATLPQIESATLKYLGVRNDRYGRVRVWGSMGFIVSVLLLGFIIDRFDIAFVPASILMFLFLTLMASLFVTAPVQREADIGATDSVFQLLITRPALIVTLLAFLIMHGTHQVFYTFFSIYLQELGFDANMIGVLWTLSVISEIVLLWFCHELFARLPIASILTFSMLVAAIRWCLLAWLPEYLLLLIVLQISHAITFGAFHVAAVRYIHEQFPGRLSNQGQGLYTSVSVGAGGALGGLLSGWSWQQWGGQETFFAAGVLTLAAVMLSYLFAGVDSTKVGGKVLA